MTDRDMPTLRFTSAELVSRLLNPMQQLLWVACKELGLTPGSSTAGAARVDESPAIVRKDANPGPLPRPMGEGPGMHEDVSEPRYDAPAHAEPLRTAEPSVGRSVVLDEPRSRIEPTHAHVAPEGGAARLARGPVEHDSSSSSSSAFASTTAVLLLASDQRRSGTTAPWLPQAPSSPGAIGVSPEPPLDPAAPQATRTTTRVRVRPRDEGAPELHGHVQPAASSHSLDDGRRRALAGPTSGLFRLRPAHPPANGSEIQVSAPPATVPAFDRHRDVAPYASPRTAIDATWKSEAARTPSLDEAADPSPIRTASEPAAVLPTMRNALPPCATAPALELDAPSSPPLPSAPLPSHAKPQSTVDRSSPLVLATRSFVSVVRPLGEDATVADSPAHTTLDLAPSRFTREPVALGLSTSSALASSTVTEPRLTSEPRRSSATMSSAPEVHGSLDVSALGSDQPLASPTSGFVRLRPAHPPADGSELPASAPPAMVPASDLVPRATAPALELDAPSSSPLPSAPLPSHAKPQSTVDRSSPLNRAAIAPASTPHVQRPDRSLLLATRSLVPVARPLDEVTDASRAEPLPLASSDPSPGAPWLEQGSSHTALPSQPSAPLVLRPRASIDPATTCSRPSSSPVPRGLSSDPLNPAASTPNPTVTTAISEHALATVIAAAARRHGIDV